MTQQPPGVDVNLFYDRDGIPIDGRTFERLHRDRSYCRVLRTTVTSAADPAKTFDVSTVWLGVDHSFGDGVPLLFETMVFGDGALDHACRRYMTEATARAGHVEEVTIVASSLDDPVVMDAEPDTGIKFFYPQEED
jgi:hypothetical protein